MAGSKYKKNNRSKPKPDVAEQLSLLTPVCEATIVYRTKLKMRELPKIASSLDAYNHVRPFYEQQDFENKEYFFVTLINNANRVMATLKISEGGITGTVVDARIVFMAALISGATSIILSHNHPSGNLKPSQADIDLTRKVKDAGKLLEIKLLDHLIVCEDGYCSLADENLL